MECYLECFWDWEWLMFWFEVILCSDRCLIRSESIWLILLDIYKYKEYIEMLLELMVEPHIARNRDRSRVILFVNRVISQMDISTFQLWYVIVFWTESKIILFM
jgi:hypothetical protein